MNVVGDGDVEIDEVTREKRLFPCDRVCSQTFKNEDCIIIASPSSSLCLHATADKRSETNGDLRCACDVSRGPGPDPRPLAKSPCRFPACRESGFPPRLHTLRARRRVSGMHAICAVEAARAAGLSLLSAACQPACPVCGFSVDVASRGPSCVYRSRRSNMGSGTERRGKIFYFRRTCRVDAMQARDGVQSQ